MCKICNQEEENMCHLIYYCAKIDQIWRQISQMISTVNISKKTISLGLSEVMFGMKKVSGKRDNHEILIMNCIIMETKWYIWKSRNVIKYENKTIDKAHIFNAIKDAVIDQLQWQHELDLRNEFQRTCTL